jgi:hypothetical protein
MTTPEDKVRQNLADRTAAIMGNAALSDRAKRAQIARHYVRAKATITEAEAATAEARKTATAKSMRAAFGAADRAALEKVATIKDPRIADALLTQAHDTGDDGLATAVAYRAHNVGGSEWDEVLQRFIADRPVQAAAVNELRQPQPHPIDVAMSGRFYTPKPSLLSDLQDYQIERLANDDLATDAPAHVSFAR